MSDSEIKNISESQVIDNKAVYGVFPGGNESAPDRNRTCNLRFRRQNADEAETLEIKRDLDSSKSQGVQNGVQNFLDERFAELVQAWSTLPKSTQLGIIAIYDVGKSNSLESGISGIIGMMPPEANPGTGSGAESPCPARARTTREGVDFLA